MKKKITLTIPKGLPQQFNKGSDIIGVNADIAEQCQLIPATVKATGWKKDSIELVVLKRFNALWDSGIRRHYSKVTIGEGKSIKVRKKVDGVDKLVSYKLGEASEGVCKAWLMQKGLWAGKIGEAYNARVKKRIGLGQACSELIKNTAYGSFTTSESEDGVLTTVVRAKHTA